MSRYLPLLLAAIGSLYSPVECAAQTGRPQRPETLRDLAIWRRNSLSVQELRQAANGMTSNDPVAQRVGVEAIAYGKPVPEHAEAVTRGLTRFQSLSNDRELKRLATQACFDWDEAKLAWQVLQDAKRRGGFRALEQAITQGDSPKLGSIMIATAYCGDDRAPKLLAEHWRTSRLHGGKALAIIGPPAAPFLAEQLDPADVGLCLETVKQLAEIGTEAEIPRLQEMLASTNRLLKQAIEEAIARIRSRVESR